MARVRSRPRLKIRRSQLIDKLTDVRNEILAHDNGDEIDMDVVLEFLGIVNHLEDIQVDLDYHDRADARANALIGDEEDDMPDEEAV